MRIILDIAFLSNEPGARQFLFDTIIEMAGRYRNDSYVFLTHEQGKTFSNLPSNVSSRFIKIGPLRWLGKKWWYRNILPKRLQSLQPDLFITIDNIYVNNGPLPTCLFFIHLNAALEAIQTSDRTGPKLPGLSFNKATSVITFSEYSRQLIQRQTSTAIEKIKLLRIGLNNPLTPLTWTEKEAIKVQYAAGCEYFVFAGEIDAHHHILELLKAFSQFKKRQQSNMQLVLASHKTPWMIELVEKLSTFKYRTDVHIIANPLPGELEAIIGAAYAFVYPAQVDYFPVNIVRAMQSGVPVIASRLPVIEEIAGNAIIYTENDENGFAKNMQDIYKDENSRSAVINRANDRVLGLRNYDIVEDCRNIFEAIFTTKS